MFSTVLAAIAVKPSAKTMPEALPLVLVIGEESCCKLQRLGPLRCNCEGVCIASHCCEAIGSDEINVRAGREIAGGKTPRVVSAIMK